MLLYDIKLFKSYCFISVFYWFALLLLDLPACMDQSLETVDLEWVTESVGICGPASQDPTPSLMEDRPITHSLTHIYGLYGVADPHYWYQCGICLHMTWPRITWHCTCLHRITGSRRDTNLLYWPKSPGLIITGASPCLRIYTSNLVASILDSLEQQ